MPVIPAKAGIHSVGSALSKVWGMDSRFRGNDWDLECPGLASDTTSRGKPAACVARKLPREPETAGLEASAQSEVMHQQLDMDGIDQGSQPHPDRFNRDEAHVGEVGKRQVGVKQDAPAVLTDILRQPEQAIVGGYP